MLHWAGHHTDRPICRLYLYDLETTIRHILALSKPLCTFWSWCLFIEYSRLPTHQSFAWLPSTAHTSHDQKSRARVKRVAADEYTNEGMQSSQHWYNSIIGFTHSVSNPSIRKWSSPCRKTVQKYLSKRTKHLPETQMSQSPNGSSVQPPPIEHARHFRNLPSRIPMANQSLLKYLAATHKRSNISTRTCVLSGA